MPNWLGYAHTRHFHPQPADPRMRARAHTRSARAQEARLSRLLADASSLHIGPQGLLKHIHVDGRNRLIWTCLPDHLVQNPVIPRLQAALRFLPYPSYLVGSALWQHDPPDWDVRLVLRPQTFKCRFKLPPSAITPPPDMPPDPSFTPRLQAFHALERDLEAQLQTHVSDLGAQVHFKIWPASHFNHRSHLSLHLMDRHHAKWYRRRQGRPAIPKETETRHDRRIEARAARARALAGYPGGLERRGGAEDATPGPLPRSG